MAAYFQDPSPPVPRPAPSSASSFSVLNHAQCIQRTKTQPRPGTRSDARTRSKHVHSKSPELRSASLACTSRASILTKSEFEFCRQSLKCVFRRCSDMEFLRLSSLLSCLLHCFRPLHQSDVLSIFGILLDGAAEGEGSGKQTYEEALAWLKLKCRELVFIDMAGYIRLAHPMLRQFLLSCPIQGIDRTHSTLAKACLMQLEADSRSQLPGTPIMTTSSAPFSEYASKNWQDHYRFVQRTSPGLTARVHNMLQSWLSVKTPDSSLEQSIEHLTQSSEAALTISENLGLDVLAHSYSQLLAARERRSAPHLIDSRSAASIRITDMDETFGSLQLDSSEATDSDSSNDEWVLL